MQSNSYIKQQQQQELNLSEQQKKNIELLKQTLEVEHKPSRKSLSAVGKPHPKNKFSEQEDQQLFQLVQVYGDKDWDLISRLMVTRNSRQCRERYTNYLNPSIRNDPWSEDEDSLLLSKYQEFGCKWVKISHFFPHRTDSQLKNRFQVLKRKGKILRQYQLSKQTTTTSSTTPVLTTTSSTNSSLSNSPQLSNETSPIMYNQANQLYQQQIPQYPAQYQYPQFYNQQETQQTIFEEQQNNEIPMCINEKDQNGSLNVQNDAITNNLIDSFAPLDLFDDQANDWLIF